MDKYMFNQACEKVLNSEQSRKLPYNIGTLGEKTLHAILKHYLEPEESKHEIKLDSYYADILNDDGIIEIQTRQFNKLRNKLDIFLKSGNVTIAYPIPHTKWLIWIDPDTGEVSKKRKSPKTGSPYEIFLELYKISYLLNNVNLSLHIFMVDIEEYRYLNGWSKDGKKGSSRYDRIPVDINQEIIIKSKYDYLKLIPNTLGEKYTSKDFMKASSISLKAAQTALKVLYTLGIVKRIGKTGNLYLYSHQSEQSDNQ